MFLAAPAEPHKQRALCCGPSPKGTICPPELGPPALTAMVGPNGTPRVDVAQKASRINHHLFPHQHTSLPLLLPSSLLLYPATSIPMTACQQSALSQREGRKKENKGRREMGRRALSSCNRKAVERVVMSSDRKLREHPRCRSSVEVSQSQHRPVIAEKQCSGRGAW